MSTAQKSQSKEPRTFSQVLRILDAKWKKKNLPLEVRKVYRHINHKPVCKALAEALDIPQARQLGSGLSLQDAVSWLMDWSKDTEFVLKPEEGANGQCVIRLVSLGDGRFRSLTTGSIWSHTRLLNQLGADLERFGRRDAWIIEEFLRPAVDNGELVDDFKFYAFHGEVACILQRKHFLEHGKRRVRHQWYDAGWSVTDTGKHPDLIDDRIRPPAEAEQLSAAASDWSRRLLVPFSRLDLYSTANGPILGEITPRPGNASGFNDHWQHGLAVAWKRAADLLAKDLEAGKHKKLVRRHMRVAKQL